MTAFVQQTRDIILLLDTVLEQIDALTKRIVGTRWNLEVIRRHPEMGVVNAQGGPRTVGAEEVKARLTGLEQERDIYGNTLTEMFGCDLQEIRDRYFGLKTAYANWVHLKELSIGATLDSFEAFEILGNMNLLNENERTEAVAKAETALKAALELLPLGEPSAVIAAHSLVLPQ